MATTIDRRAYFDRIGYAGSERPTLEVLSAIADAHAKAIPFENLDPLCGRNVRLDPESIERKLVHGRRGGYCFEHNLLLLDVLEQLGFETRPLSARVLWNRAPTDPVGARGHMLIEVKLEEGPHLVDVGFGGLTLTGPMRMVPDLIQRVGNDVLRLRPLDEDLVLEVEIEGAFRALYRFDRARAYRADYELVSYYLCNAPDSHFRRALMAARATNDGRLTLRGNTFVVRRRDAQPVTRVLENIAELKEVLAGPFGIALEESAELEAGLAKNFQNAG